LPKLGQLTKKISALVSVEPFCRDNSTQKGKRTTSGGRTQGRSILYMDVEKTKEVALVACMRKPLTVANSMIRNNTEWNPNHGKLA